MRGRSLDIVKEGKIRKFCPQVTQLTFSAVQAMKRGQQVLYITERAVFSLEAEGLMLRELAPGITLQQLREAMDCPFQVADSILDLNSVEVETPAESHFQ